MAKINKHIEIVSSAEKSLSSMSSKSREMVKKVLEKHYTNVGITLVNDSRGLEQLIDKNPDLVFTGIKRVPIGEYDSMNNEYVWVSGFLEDRGVTVTGSGSGAIELELDKIKAKDVVKAAGLTTSPYFIAKVGEYTDESQLPFGFPIFLKPRDRGAGVGIGDDSVVRNFDEFSRKIKSISNDFQGAALAESYLSGREFSVALLKELSLKEFLVMPVEIIAAKNDRGDRILGEETKEENNEQVIAVPEGRIRELVINLAKETFKALGSRDYGRIDIRLDKNGVPNFLEANLVPSMINDFGNFPKAFKMNTGRNYEEMLLHIVDLAFARQNDLQ